MKHSARSAMAAGVSMLAVSAAVIAPVQPTPTPAPTSTPAPAVELAAAVQPLQPGKEPPRIPALLQASGLLPTVVPTALPGAPSVLAVPIAPNLANDIDNLYLAVEPWVQYGFEVATYALAWIPYVGFLSGLIMDGYFFGESIVASAVFNFTDFLRGDGGIVENLVDFGVDVGLAFVWLGIDVVGTFIPLPPCCYPPRPPVQGPFLALDALTTLMKPEAEAQGTELDKTVGEQVEGVGNEATPEEGTPAKKTVRELVGELIDRYTGEPVRADEEQLEEPKVDELSDEAEGELADETEEANEATPASGLVRAQGLIRESLAAKPNGQSSQPKNGTGPRGGNLTEKLTELAQSFAPKKPSSNDDGATSTADAGAGAGDSTGTE